MTCTSFLVAVLEGDVQSEILWELPAAEHEFRPSGDFV